MKTVQHSVRLPAALDTALRALADRQGKTVYAMLRRCVKTGIDGQVNPTVSSSRAASSCWSTKPTRSPSLAKRPRCITRTGRV